MYHKMKFHYFSMYQFLYLVRSFLLFLSLKSFLHVSVIFFLFVNPSLANFSVGFLLSLPVFAAVLSVWTPIYFPRYIHPQLFQVDFLLQVEEIEKAGGERR